MGLELKAEEKSILALFTGDKNQYVIPPYQRPYSWDEEQCRELFEDLQRAFEDEKISSYFLGNIVIASSNENKNRLEVIDGQQRLTTLTLLLKALLFFDTTNKKLRNSIWELDDRTDEPKEQRLETMVFQDKDSKFLKESLDIDFDNTDCKFTKKDNQYKKNICFFYTELKKLPNNTLNKFVDFLLYDVSILPIQTQGENREIARENALKIFETINNRGLPLSDSDIFKAKLFSMALSEDESEKFIERWSTLYEECQDVNYKIDDIFRFYTHIIRAGKEKYKSEIGLRDFYSQGDSPFLDKKKKYTDILSDLFDIIESIKFFKKINREPQENQELTKWFQLISLYTNQYPLNTLFVYLYQNKLKIDTKLINFSRELVKFIYAYGATSELKQTLWDINNSIIKKELKKFPQPKSIKENKFDSFGMLKKGFALLSLYLNTEQEAIYPYNINRIINSRDKNELNDSWEEVEYANYIDTIGNMLVLDKNISRDVKLSSKITVIKESKITEIQELSSSLVDWSYTDYLKREKSLKQRFKIFFEVLDEN